MTKAVELAQVASTGVSEAFKNRIINGAMVIAQRGTGAVTNNAADFVWPVDRVPVYGTVTGKFTAQQNAGSVTPPAGFTNYLGCTSLSAYTVGASENFFIKQLIEGFNVADLGFGTANAQTVTLSFWVRSSLTGTFGGALQNGAVDRSYPFTYTISAANTWEQKSITIPGDTTGTWLTNNGIGLQVVIGLGVGSSVSGTAGAWVGANRPSATGATSVVGTNGATFYITGLQLEVGSSATSFEYRSYGTELMLCQRYYELLYIRYTDFWNGTNSMRIPIPMKVEKRATPTGTLANGNWAGDQLNFVAASFIASYPSESALSVDGSGSGVMTRYSNSVAMSAEL